MDIHKPKPWRGWREFLKEYAIIVVGVLTALAGEQAVETMNWRHEVAETEKALQAELGHNARSQLWRLEQSGCVRARLADLQAWRDSIAAGRPLKPIAPIGQPVWYGYSQDSWSVAQTGQVAAHIPLERRIKYAELYNSAEKQTEQQVRESDLWHALHEFEGAGDLDHHDLMRLQGLMASIEGAQNNYALNYPAAKVRWIALGITPEAKNPQAKARGIVAAELCRRMFAAG